MATYSSWKVSGASIDYVPIENPVNETVKLFNGKEQGSVPPTTNLSSNTGQYILAQDGTWIPQPSFTSGGSDAFEILRPSVLTPTYSAYTPTVTNSANAYDVDTNHATTFGEWECAFVSRNLPITDTLLFTSFGSKTQTWTSATINISRAYGYFNDGESNSSSKVTSVKVEFSTNGGSSWTTIVTDLSTAVPLTATTSSYTFTTTPTMGNVQVKLTLVRGGGGMIYDPEIGISVPGSTGDIDLRLYDIWISGTYSGGSGNITCNNLTVTGDATFQNKIYDSTASAGTTGQVLKVASNGKVTWATDSAGTGTVTSITTTGANGVTISGGSTQTITTSGTFALALGNITPTSISTGTGSFSGDVEFAASIKSPNGSNSPIVISPDGTGDLHVNADSLRLGDNNANATIATNGIGDLILTTNEGSSTEGIIRLYDGANGNITLTPNGTGQVQVGSDQVVTLTASQTLTNKTLSTSSTWNGNVIGSAYGGAGTVNGILKANGSGTVSAASAGTDYVTSVSVTSPVSNTGTTANPTIALGSGYGDTQNPYGSKTANYFLAAPNGSAGVPTFRAIVAADIPTLNQNTTGTAANITATSNTTLTTLSSLVSIGTITTGTWNASAIGVAYGGTGLSTLTAGYIPYGNGTSAFGSSANLFWDSTNSRLGIGTTSPSNKLSVSGSSDISGSLGIGTSSPVSKLTLSGTGTGAWITVNRTDSGSNIIDFTQSGSRLGYVGYIVNDLWINQVGSANIIFNTNATERMRIDSSGNVGIGVTPSAWGSSWTALQLKNGSWFSNPSISLNYILGNAYFDGTNYKYYANGYATEYYFGGYNGTHVWSTASSGNAGNSVTLNERMRITNGGDVLVNATATADSSKLYVAGNLGTNGSQFNFRPGSGTYYELVNRVGAGFDFYVNNAGTLAARIDSSGNLLIGNTNGTEKLTVTGNIRASGVYVGNGSTGSYTKGFGAIQTSSSTPATPSGGAAGDHFYYY